MHGSIANPLVLTIFAVVVVSMLVIDLGVFHRRPHAVKFKEAMAWSIVWVVISLAFAAGVYFWFGAEVSLQFLTGYIIEKALSVDNIFVFVVLFAAFGVPAAYQHRVLYWGVIGALVMRAAFILMGTALIQRFHWVMYVFGAILVATAVKLVMSRGESPHPEKNPIFKFFSRLVPSTPHYHGAKFTIVENGRRLATPLLMVLLAIESTDVVFAVDSIPAIFAVSTDPFIVYSSNVFAILGLRAMYFLLVGVIEKFRFVTYGLAAVLAFVGVKMLISGFYQVPIGISLAVIVLILGASIAISLLKPAARA